MHGNMGKRKMGLAIAMKVGVLSRLPFLVSLSLFGSAFLFCFSSGSASCILLSIFFMFGSGPFTRHLATPGQKCAGWRDGRDLMQDLELFPVRVGSAECHIWLA
jgi:hypothetical protein